MQYLLPVPALAPEYPTAERGWERFITGFSAPRRARPRTHFRRADGVEIRSVCGPTKPESRGKLAPRATPLRGVLSGQPRLLPRFKGEFARLALRDSAGLEHTRRQRPEVGRRRGIPGAQLHALSVFLRNPAHRRLDVGDYWTSTDGSAWRGAFEHLRRWFRLPRKFVDRLVGDARRSTNPRPALERRPMAPWSPSSESPPKTSGSPSMTSNWILDHKAYVEAFPLCPPLTTRLPVVKAIRDAELLARDQLGLKENQIWVLRIRNIKHTPRGANLSNNQNVPEFYFQVLGPDRDKTAGERRPRAAGGLGKPEQMIQSIGNEAPEEEILEYLTNCNSTRIPARAYSARRSIPLSPARP